LTFGRRFSIDRRRGAAARLVRSLRNALLDCAKPRVFTVALACSSTPRTLLPPVCRRGLIAAGVFIASLTSMPGCRSASSTDLVEREMRQQEDQIYALQDYLAEYQQLLCEYRQENESLKRQMVTGQFRESLPTPRRSETRPPSRTTPTPPSEPPTPDEDTTPPADIPPLEFDQSDIPPLDTTSAVDSEGTLHAIAENEAGDVTALETDANDPNVTLAAFDEPVPVDAAAWSVEQVLVRGEVWPGAGTDGPRLLVDLDPLTTTGRPAELSGDLSLMVLDTDSDGTQQSLARWDFTPDQWQPMVVEGTNGSAVQLPLQLPAEAATDGPVELWVRLVPEKGEKVLAHVEVDLGRPGQFESEVSILPAANDPADDGAAAEIAADPAIHNAAGEPRTASQSTAAIRQSDWQTARPGEIPQPAASATTNVSAWRTATQPIPEVAEPPIYDTAMRGKVVVRGSPDPAPIGGVVGRPHHSEAPRPEQDKLRPPKWSPDRPGNTAGRSALDQAPQRPPVDHILAPPRPVWTPNR
jgi:hypothetical protein